MASFYNAADQELYKKYQYLPQEKYRSGLNLPTDPVADPVAPVPGGITNTNAFTGSGGNDGFSSTGNMFGEGTAVSPVFGNSYIDTVRREGGDSLDAYEKLIEAGGTAPGGMFQTDYFPGTENELADAMGRMPGQPNYDPNISMSEDAFQKAEDKRGFLSKLMNNAKQNMTKLPDWAKTAITAAGFINPFTAVPKLLGTGGGDGGPSYGIAGLTDRQKNLYDTLASQRMLYETPSGYKTFDGKNFGGKSGFSEESIKDFYDDKIDRFDSIEKYRDYLKKGGAKKDPKNVTNLVKTLKMYDLANTSDNKFTDFNRKDPPIDTDRPNDKIDNKDGGSGYKTNVTVTGPSYGPHQDNKDRGDPGNSGNPTGSPGSKGPGGSDEMGSFARGGRAGYFFGGRVNYKQGGRTGYFLGGNIEGGYSESRNDSGGKQTTTSYSDNDDGGASDNPPVTVVNNNPVDVSTVTKSVGDYEIPYGVEALMANKGRLQAVLNADNVLDKNLGAEFTYDNGPFSIGAYADMDGDKSLNANYTRNNSNYSFDLNDDGGQLKYSKTFANGGLASIL